MSEGLARAIDAIPYVATTALRNARYPAPAANFRVQNGETGAIERWDGAVWTTATVGNDLVVDVTQAPYNAAGDGVVDDTVAIQAALTATAGTGRVVYLPRGTYRVTAPLVVQDSHAIMGDPTVQFFDLRYVTNYPGTRIVQGTPTANVLEIRVPTVAERSLVSHITDIAISGSFTNGNAAGGHGIALIGDTTATFNNAQLLWTRVSVTRVSGRGFSLVGPFYGSRLIELWAYNCGLAGIHATAPTPGDATSEILGDGWHAFNNGYASTAAGTDRCGIFVNTRGSSWCGVRWSGTGNKGIGIWFTGSSGTHLVAPTAESNEGLVTSAPQCQILIGAAVAAGVSDGIVGCVVTAPTVAHGTFNGNGLVVNESANFTYVSGYRGFDTTTADDIAISPSADYTTLVNCRMVEGLSDGSTTTARINCLVVAAAQTRLPNLPTGFYGATPVARPAAIPDASGGATVDTQARTAINALLAAARSLGLIAT